MTTIGTRIELHPATDTWMRGDRYGTVIKVGRKWVHVKMDRSKRTLRFSPDLVQALDIHGVKTPWSAT